MSLKEKGAARAEVKSDPGVKGIMSAFVKGASADDLSAMNEEFNADADVGETEEGAVDGPDSEHSVHSRDGSDGEETVVGEEEEADATEEDTAATDGDETETDEDPVAEDAATTTTGPEEFWVTDESGRRQVKVDFGSKRAREQLVGAAYGMKKFRAERDSAISRLKEYENPESKTAKELTKFRSMDKAFADGGPEAVLREMGVDPDKFIDEKILHRKNLEALKGNPAEWAKYQEKLANERADKVIAKVQADREAEKAERIAEVEAANQKTFDAARERAFGVIRLDDAAPEDAALNEIMWDALNARIDRLPDETVLTDAVLSGLAKDVAKSLGKRVKKEAAAAVKGTMDRKRAEAGKAAQAAMRSGTARASGTSKLEDAYDKGGVRGAIAKAFGRG